MFLLLLSELKFYMKYLFIALISLIIIYPNISFSQTLPKKPRASDVRSMNQQNLMKIEIGTTKNEAIEIMGGIKTIQDKEQFQNFLNYRQFGICLI